MANKKIKKRKILFIVQLPPPIHGASLRNKELVESKKINNIFNIKTIPLRFTKNIENLSKFSVLKILKSFMLIFKIKKELIFFRPDIVFSSFSPNNFAFVRDFIYSIIIKIFCKNRVFIIRERIKKGKFKNKLLGFAFKNSKIIVLSDFIKKELDKIKDNLNISVIYDGIKTIVSENKLNTKKTDIPVILFLSNLIVNKGGGIFLESLKILKERGINFKAVITGAPVEITEQELYDKIEKLGLTDNVEYSGFVKGDKRFKIYLNSDIFVLPTLRETFPGVILEAMQSGLPVIGTIEGGIPEIIADGNTGFLVPKNDSLKIADKLEYLIKNPEIAREMGLRGRKRFIEKFSFEMMEKKYIELFEEILKTEN